MLHRSMLHVYNFTSILGKTLSLLCLTLSLFFSVQCEKKLIHLIPRLFRMYSIFAHHCQYWKNLHSFRGAFWMCWKLIYSAAVSRQMATYLFISLCLSQLTKLTEYHAFADICSEAGSLQALALARSPVLVMRAGIHQGLCQTVFVKICTVSSYAKRDSSFLMEEPILEPHWFSQEN